MKRCRPIAAVLTLCGLVSQLCAADWPQYRCTPQRTGRSPEKFALPEGAKPKVLWQKKFWPERIIDAVQPIVADGKVYLGSRDGTMYCLDEKDGREVWTKRGFGPVLCAGACVDGKTIFGSLDGRVRALDGETGKEAWKISGPKGFTTAPLIAEGNVYIGSRAGTFFCIEPKQGRVLWQVDTQSYILQSAAYDDGKVYFGTEDCCMRAYEAKTGKLIWKSKPLYMQSMGPYAPVVHGGYVIFRCGWTQRTSWREEADLSAGSSWGLAKWAETFRNKAPLPASFYRVQDELVKRLSKPGVRELYVLNARTGIEEFIVPHWPSNGALGAGAPVPPPIVDADGLLVLTVVLHAGRGKGSAWGRLDLKKRRVVDVLLDPNKRSAFDQSKYVSAAGDLVFSFHISGTPWLAYQGAFHLPSRAWQRIPACVGGTAGTGFTTQTGVGCAISNGRVHHVERNFLVCRGWR